MFDFCKLILYPGILLNFLLFVLVFSLILLDFPGITCKGIALLPPCTVLMPLIIFPCPISLANTSNKKVTRWRWCHPCIVWGLMAMLLIFKHEERCKPYFFNLNSLANVKELVTNAYFIECFFFKSGMGAKFCERPTLSLYKENHNKGFDCYL